MLSYLMFCAAMAVCDTVQQVPYHAIVIDAETKARIRDAKVVVDDNANVLKTIWDGSFSVAQPFKQIKITKRGYLTRVMNYEERTDTIILLNDASSRMGKTTNDANGFRWDVSLHCKSHTTEVCRGWY